MITIKDFYFATVSFLKYFLTITLLLFLISLSFSFLERNAYLARSLFAAFDSLLWFLALSVMLPQNCSNIWLQLVSKFLKWFIPIIFFAFKLFSKYFYYSVQPFSLIFVLSTFCNIFS